jgi:hypothetical protein
MSDEPVESMLKTIRRRAKDSYWLIAGDAQYDVTWLIGEYDRLLARAERYAEALRLIVDCDLCNDCSEEARQALDEPEQ